MKRTIEKFSRKVMTVIALAIVFALANPGKSSAAGHTIEIPADSTDASVKFLGTSGESLLFNITVSNPDNNKFRLFIQDANGNVLYSKNYSENYFEKTIKLLKDDYMDSYNFIIESKDKSLSNIFVVEAKSKTINEVEVTKL